MARNKRLPKLPPSGVITAMFTDIVNSTRLKCLMEGDTAARRNARFRSDVKKPHDTIVLTCIEAADGHKVKSTGDGYLFTFTDAEEAVSVRSRFRTNFVSILSTRHLDHCKCALGCTRVLPVPPVMSTLP
jgi:class 3 adenylate cyclase